MWFTDELHVFLLQHKLGLNIFNKTMLTFDDKDRYFNMIWIIKWLNWRPSSLSEITPKNIIMGFTSLSVLTPSQLLLNLRPKMVA